MLVTDFTLPEQRDQVWEFQPDELTVFATPTYAGKLPNKLLPFIRAGFAGNGAPAVALVTFGNRSFDNSLAELCDCLTGDGFRIAAAGAFAAQHAFAEIGVGRPDEQDLAALNVFGQEILQKLRARKRLPAATLTVPGSADAPYYKPLCLDGSPAVFLKAKPKTDPALCDGCGLCARLCPMGSISREDPAEVPGVCIKCQHCVVSCPKGAKYFDDPAFLSHKAMLERNYARRAEPQWFL